MTDVKFNKKCKILNTKKLNFRKIPFAKKNSTLKFSQLSAAVSMKGAIHKRRHQLRRRGLPKENIILLLIGSFSKNDDEGGGSKNLKKLMTSFMNGP